MDSLVFFGLCDVEQFVGSCPLTFFHFPRTYRTYRDVLLGCVAEEVADEFHAPLAAPSLTQCEQTCTDPTRGSTSSLWI